jgi:hypothetical protein
MRFVWLLLILVGVWFLASAATTEGLLPSGHGTGRISEVIEGLVLIVLGVCRLLRQRGSLGTVSPAR